MRLDLVGGHDMLQVQQEYEDCVQAHDPNLLARLVQKHPYHVDALLSLVELYQSVRIDAGATVTGGARSVG